MGRAWEEAPANAQDGVQRAGLQAILRSGRDRPYACGMPRAALLALICLSVAVAGCGSGSTSGGDDPASAVPASAAIYVDATVRPDGELRNDALAAAGKVLGISDPQAKIDELVAKVFADSEHPKLDYARDVKPWLGEKVALWAATTRGDEFRGAVIASATDTEAAQAAIDRAVKGSEKSFTKRSYEGVDYQASEKGAAGIVEDFAVFGTEAEFKRTVDAAKGDGLASDDRFRKATDGLEDDRLGTFYFDVKTLLDQAARQDPEAAQQLEQAKRLFPFDKVGPVAGEFLADGERLAVNAAADVPEGSAAGSLGAITSGGATPLLGELPADSWAALGSPKLGQTIKLVYQQAAGALGGAAVEQQLRSQLGIDLQEDVFSWIGDVAFFARGTTMDSIEGGAVIEVTDPAKAKAAFGKLIGLAQSRGGAQTKPIRIEGAETAFEAALPGAPKSIVAARSEDRVVIAYGREAAADAFSPTDKLGDSDTYSEAKSVLGGDVEPGFLISIPAVVELASTASGGDPEFEKAKPYLEAFSVLAGGSSRDGDTARSSFAAGLK